MTIEQNQAICLLRLPQHWNSAEKNVIFGLVHDNKPIVVYNDWRYFAIFGYGSTLVVLSRGRAVVSLSLWLGEGPGFESLSRNYKY